MWHHEASAKLRGYHWGRLVGDLGSPNKTARRQQARQKALSITSLLSSQGLEGSCPLQL